MGERTNEEVTEDESKETDRYLADENPEQILSGQRALDHSPDNYTSGYDSFGNTRVGIGDAGGDVRKLIRHNEGRHRSDGNHSTREAARDKVRVTEAFCSTLDINSYRQGLAVSAMKIMNLDRFGRQKRLAKVALATIKVIVDWDRSRRFSDESLADLDEEEFPTRMSAESDYRAILDQQDISMADLYSVSQLVKRELKKDAFFTPSERGNSDATTNPDTEGKQG